MRARIGGTWRGQREVEPACYRTIGAGRPVIFLGAEPGGSAWLLWWSGGDGIEGWWFASLADAWAEFQALDEVAA